MICQTLETQIESYLDSQLDETQQRQIQRHLVECGPCRMRVENIQRLRESLRRLPIAEASVDFEHRMLNVLQAGEESKPHHHRHQWLWGAFGGAIAASLLTWTVMLPATLGTGATDPIALASVQTVSLKINEPQSIRLVFNAPADMENVTVSLKLLNHLEIDGYPDQQEIKWTTRLKAGQNVLTLPVIARGYEQGELIARISDKGKSKEFRVVTQTGDRQDFI